MSEKESGVYKTEEQLKQEAKIRLEQEAKLSNSRPKTEIQRKRENFWYHYKWQTIGGAFALILIVFFVKDLFFRTMPDATVIMVSKQYYSTESIEALAAALENAATDFNGDGKVNILVDYMVLPDDAAMNSGQQDYAMAMKLVTVIAAGADPIYLLDDDAHQYMVAMGAGEGSQPDPSEVFAPENAALDSLVFTEPGYKSEFENLRFYLRHPANNSEKYYEYCRALINSLNGG